MKTLYLSRVLIVALLFFAFGSTASASETPKTKIQIMQEYRGYVENGKTYKDAFEALQYEIAYESAAVHAKSPCRKLVRGL